MDTRTVEQMRLERCRTIITMVLELEAIRERLSARIEELQKELDNHVNLLAK